MPIQTTITDTPVPVDIIPMTRLAEQGGQFDLAQTLTYISPSFNSTRQNGADGADLIDSAALRGLDVRLLVPRRTDSALVSAAARSYYDELIGAGVRVYEYGPRMLHTKALLVDEDEAIIGTSNFDTRSFSLNFEIVMLFRDAGVAGALQRSLETDMASAVEVRKDSPKPAATVRFGEAAARLFAPLL